MIDKVRKNFQGAILRHFDYLFTTHNFRTVENENYRTGEYQILIAASTQCKVKFILEQDYFEVSFGQLDAPGSFGNEDKSGRVFWRNMLSVIAYEDSVGPEHAVKLPRVPDQDDLEVRLAAYASLLRPYLDRLILAFSPNPPPGWWQGYEAFLDARHKAYEARKHP